MVPELFLDILTDKKKVNKYAVHCNGLTKRCRVCNDAAFGFNFGGVTCESCKAFFRRHAQRMEKLHCFNDDNCSIDIENRRFCKRCRLKKCFQIGMDKDLLLQKRRKPSTPFFESPPNPSTRMRLFSGDQEDILINSPDPPTLDLEQIRFLESSQPSMQLLFEQDCIEIIKKLPILFTENPSSKPAIAGYTNKLSSVVACQEYFIHGIIQFGQFLKPFLSLNQSDQLSILKQSFPEIMMLRSAFYYNFEKDAFYCRLDQYVTEVFYVDLNFFYNGNEHLVEMHRKLALILREELQYDTVIRDLLSLLIMFRANDNISCPEFLRYNFVKYCHLLQNYLEMKNGDKEKAIRQHERLLKTLEMIVPLKAVYYEILANCNTTKLSQTLTEIYEI